MYGQFRYFGDLRFQSCSSSGRGYSTFLTFGQIIYLVVDCVFYCFLFKLDINDPGEGGKHPLHFSVLASKRDKPDTANTAYMAEVFSFNKINQFSFIHSAMYFCLCQSYYKSFLSFSFSFILYFPFFLFFLSFFRFSFSLSFLL